MAALFNSVIRALGTVAASVLVVAIVWTIYINRESLVDIAAPVVTPLLDAVPANGFTQEKSSDPERDPQTSHNATADPSPEPARGSTQ